MSAELQKTQPEHSSIEFLDERDHIYGEGEPWSAGSTMQHRSTQREFKERHAPGGQNARLLGCMVVVFIYQYWDEDLRQQLADAAGVAKNEVRSDVFGEVRHLRHA